MMNSMSYIGKFISNFRDFYNEINAATLTGAIDVVVVEQPDRSFTCSPFHVRFGKLGVLRSREKVVDIEINGEPLDIHMKLGESGEAFFVEEVTPSELGDDEIIPPHLACSPIPDDAFLSRFHDAGTTVNEIHDNTQITVDLHEKYVGITHMCQQSRYERFQNEESDVDKLSEGISKVQSEVSSQIRRAESSVTKENVAFQKPVIINAGTSLPKTFCAETLNNDDDKSEKVRRISIVAGDFRPISLIVEDNVPAIRNDEGLLIDTSLDGQNVMEECSSGQEQGSRHGLVGKDMGKDGSVPGIEDLLKPIPGGKRKRRKRSLMKKKGAAQRKNGVGSNSQMEQLEVNDTNELGKTAVEMQQGEMDDTSEGIYQVEDRNTQTDDGSSQEPCSHLGGIMINDTEGTVYTSAVDCESCSKTPLAISIGTAMAASTVSVEAVDTDNELARIQHASTETDFHFFSDTEATPGCGPYDSRPCSPVQSDSEFEINRQSKAVGVEEEGETGKSALHGQSWRWGELPSPPPRAILTSQGSRTSLSKMDLAIPEPISSSDEEGNRKQQEGEARDEEDAESGNGTSLPQSPHSVEGAIGGPKSLDSDFEEPKHSVFEKKSYGEISLSLCGGLTAADGKMSTPNEDSFLQGLVTYNDLIQNPKLVENPDLVVRFNGKYYCWRTACPLIMSLVVYQKPLPQQVVDNYVAEYMPAGQAGQKKATQQQQQTRGYSWFSSWRRPSEPKKIPNNLSTSDVSSPESEKLSDVKEGTLKNQDGIASGPESDKKDENIVNQDKEVPLNMSDNSDVFSQVDGTGSTNQSKFDDTPILSDQQKVIKEGGYSGSNSSDESDSGQTQSQSVKLSIQRRGYYENTEMYRKTLRLSSDQIARLNLNEGANEMVFSVTTAYQGTTRCKCHIYKWRYDDRVVISDIDGTITKSDVLGHILPIVGKDWAQSGVAQLFTKIKNNGYKLLYLSARAIGQARVTRDYLRSIKQGDLSLPDGPLLLNPTSLISAFHREVIEKKPEEFKISCLKDIQALFPANSKPFYAGYGNKINDVWAYRAVGIPIFRIFTINHRGELKHELTQTFQSSYSNMSYIVNDLFPPVTTLI